MCLPLPIPSPAATHHSLSVHPLPTIVTPATSRRQPPPPGTNATTACPPTYNRRPSACHHLPLPTTAAPIDTHLTAVRPRPPSPSLQGTCSRPPLPPYTDATAAVAAARRHMPVYTQPPRPPAHLSLPPTTTAQIDTPHSRTPAYHRPPTPQPSPTNVTSSAITAAVARSCRLITTAAVASPSAHHSFHCLPQQPPAITNTNARRSLTTVRQSNNCPSPPPPSLRPPADVRHRPSTPPPLRPLHAAAYPPTHNRR